MSARRRLDAVARRLDAQRRPQDDAARRERERLDAMTDDELALRLDAYARLVGFMRDCWLEEEVEPDAETAELRKTLCQLADDLTRLRAG